MTACQISISSSNDPPTQKTVSFENNACIISGKNNVVVVCQNNSTTVRGSGKIAEETYSVGNFSGVEASGIIKVHLMAGEDFSVKVRAEDNILPHLETSVAHDTLSIHLDSGSYSLTQEVEAFVTAPEFQSLKASGQVSIADRGNYQGGLINLEASGQSEIILDEFAFLSSPKILASGQSSITTTIEREISFLSASGQSEIVVGSIDAIARLDASGQSVVRLQGTPEIGSREVSGQAEVTSF